MKKLNLTAIFSLFLLAVANAQDSLVVDKEEAVSWLSKNWMWIAGAVVLIILIAALSGSSSRKSKKITTTTLSDDYGNVKKVTTEETEI